MFHIDTLRLIKRTFNRFFSLLMIVLIGVAFMMGLFSSKPIMEQSVDKYYDQYHFQDFQIYSSYGFDENDVKAIKNLEYVERCFASKMADVYSRDEKDVIKVTRVEEVTRNMNQFELIEGRLPTSNDELVIVANNMDMDVYNIGDKLELFLEDEDIYDILSVANYTIVGIAKTPSYMAKALGTSNLKNLELEIVVYVNSANFLSEYYTTVYVTVNDAAALDNFSADYAALRDQRKDDIQTFANRQQDMLKDRLLAEYRSKIADGEKELNEKKEEGQAKLDEARKQLDDARIQIIAAQTQMETLQAALSTANTRVRTLQKQYDSESTRINKEVAKIEKADKQGRNFETIRAETTSDYATYNALARLKESSSVSPYRDSISRIERENAERRNTLNDLYRQQSELNARIADSSLPADERQQAVNDLANVNSQITAVENELQVNQLLIDNLRDMENQSGTDNIDQMMQDLQDKYDGHLESQYVNCISLAQDRLRLEATKEEIQIANEAIGRVNSEITSSNKEIEEGKRQYEQGEREYLDGVVKFNDEIEKAETEIRKAYQELEELPDAKWIILDRDSHYSSYMFASNAKQMGNIGTYMPLLFYLVAALVCMTTMTRLVDEQRGQIGIFRALGFSKGQVISKYVIYAVLASLIGSVIGIIVGMMIFPVVIYETWRLMYDLPDRLSLFPINNVIICVLAFTLLMVIVTFFVVRKTLNEVPSQLLRPKAPKNAKKVFLENIQFIWRKLSFTSKITARNLIRYKTRFFMTVIGVAGCTGLLVVGWGIKDSIADVVAIQFGDIYNYNYIVNLENDHNIDEMLEVLENNLANEYVVPEMSYSSKVYLDKGDKVATVTVIDARKSNDVYNLRDRDHKTPIKLNNSGVIVSEKFADLNKIKKGDYITIESSSGLKRSVKVMEICEMYFQHYIYISREYYDAVFNENVHYNTICVKTNDGEELQRCVQDIDGYLSLMDFSNVIDSFNTMISALDYIILVIIITSGALAFVVLINLTQVNISERIREIATLKVLGFRDREINSYIFKEILLLTLIGGLIGLPLGVIWHHFIMGVIDMEMIRFSYDIKPLSFIYAYLVTIVFTFIVLNFTKKPLRKIEMIESLKSVE